MVANDPTLEFELNEGELAGEGAFGKVYFGTLTYSKLPICVKVASSKDDPTFEREYELLHRLRGERAIIQTFGMVHRNDMKCILLERADGALEQLLKDNRHLKGLPTHIVMELIADLSKAMGTLLREGVAHRDIKPLNILYFEKSTGSGIRKSFEFKLCDFGMGRSVFDADASFYTVGGTYHYMAPQVLARFANAGIRPRLNAARTDLWSLGVTLYRCMTGELPFCPTPFSPEGLYKVVSKKMDLPNAIAFKQGEYIETIESDSHPDWICQAFAYLLQYLFNQQNADVIVKVMEELGEMKGRLLYNIRSGRVMYTYPDEATVNYWFVDEWKLKASAIDLVPEQGYCALSKSGTTSFFTLPKPQIDHKGRQLWSRRTDGTWQPNIGHRRFSMIGFPSFMDSVYIICERPQAQARKMALNHSDSGKAMQELDQKLLLLSLGELYIECENAKMRLFYTTRSYSDLIGVIESHVPKAKADMEHLFHSILPRAQLPEGRKLELLRLTQHILQDRLPRSFTMEKEMNETTQVIFTSNFSLEEIIESTTLSKDRKRQNCIAMVKYLAKAEQTLKKTFDDRLQEFLATTRRIVRVAEFKENVEAELSGRKPLYKLDIALPPEYAAIPVPEHRHDEEKKLQRSSSLGKDELVRVGTPRVLPSPILPPTPMPRNHLRAQLNTPPPLPPRQKKPSMDSPIFYGSPTPSPKPGEAHVQRSPSLRSLKKEDESLNELEALAEELHITKKIQHFEAMKPGVTPDPNTREEARKNDMSPFILRALRPSPRVVKNRKKNPARCRVQ